MGSSREWARPTVDEVSDGVFRIPLPMPGNPLEAVNVYAVTSPDGVAMVDGGWAKPGAIERLEWALGKLGKRLSDIHTVLTTHFHFDHYTLAVDLKRRIGCRIALGEGERRTIDEILAGSTAVGPNSMERLLARCGVPARYTAENLFRGEGSANYMYPDVWLHDGDRFDLGRDILAVSTPGHTTGHFCFIDERAGLAFTGDHILPTITPAIGGEGPSERMPLADYLSSLQLMADRPDARLLPAHGIVAPSVHARVRELQEHHEQRLNQCLQAIGAGAGDTYDVAKALRWTRRGRRLSELAGMDQLMAVHETRFHLDVLHATGKVAVDSTGPVDRYAMA
ncbi:MBL fold metallo-hydrolase [Nakamurella lactea]|uniref:MBL fold metallo-hydrolase n=1 Tax=Nakamurella lactea TaxID=459515 RepID=UPI00041C0AB2|nr:MBL fold metallo-hydrolase [Nakamurella lactea]